MIQQNGIPADAIAMNHTPENLARLAEMRARLAAKVAAGEIPKRVPGPRTVAERLRVAEEKAQALREQAADIARRAALKAQREAESAARKAAKPASRAEKGDRVYWMQLVSRVVELERQMAQLHSDLGVS